MSQTITLPFGATLTLPASVQLPPNLALPQTNLPPASLPSVDPAVAQQVGTLVNQALAPVLTQLLGSGASGALGNVLGAAGGPIASLALGVLFRFLQTLTTQMLSHQQTNGSVPQPLQLLHDALHADLAKTFAPAPATPPQ